MTDSVFLNLSIWKDVNGYDLCWTIHCTRQRYKTLWSNVYIIQLLLNSWSTLIIRLLFNYTEFVLNFNELNIFFFHFSDQESCLRSIFRWEIFSIVFISIQVWVYKYINQSFHFKWIKSIVREQSSLHSKWNVLNFCESMLQCAVLKFRKSHQIIIHSMLKTRQFSSWSVLWLVSLPFRLTMPKYITNAQCFNRWCLW